MDKADHLRSLKAELRDLQEQKNALVKTMADKERLVDENLKYAGPATLKDLEKKISSKTFEIEKIEQSPY